MKSSNVQLWVNDQKVKVSKNLIIHIILAIAGLFGAFAFEDAAQWVAIGTAAIAAFGVLREHFKNGKFDSKKLFSANWLAYIAVIVAELTGLVIPDELLTSIESLANAIGSGDWAGLLTILFTIGNIIYQMVKNRPEKA